jgi:hypothetical protein
MAASVSMRLLRAKGCDPLVRAENAGGIGDRKIGRRWGSSVIMRPPKFDMATIQDWRVTGLNPKVEFFLEAAVNLRGAGV